MNTIPKKDLKAAAKQADIIFALVRFTHAGRHVQISKAAAIRLIDAMDEDDRNGELDRLLETNEIYTYRLSRFYSYHCQGGLVVVIG